MQITKRRLIAATALLAAGGCSQILGAPIVGRWTATENGQTIEFEFLRDGTLVTNVPMMGSGTWSALENGRYAMNFSVFGSQLTWFARIDGSQLMVDARQGGPELALTRAR